MQEGSGMLKTTVSVLQNTNDPREKELLAALAGGIRNPQQILSEIAPQYPDCFPTEPGAVNEIITIDRHFKTPQVWTTSLALDYRLPFPFRSDLTLEAMYIKDINAILQQNVNMIALMSPRCPACPVLTIAIFIREIRDNRINADITRAMLMTNTSKGHSYTLNATMNMEPVRNLNLMASYTYTRSRTLSNNARQPDRKCVATGTFRAGSQLSVHAQCFLSGLPPPCHCIASIPSNTPETLPPAFLFYTGQYNGSYTYLIDGDLNNDGSQYDLMYIPATRDELNFTDLKKTDGTVMLFPRLSREEAFWAFVEQDPYLRKRKGKYAETNGAFQPWYHRFDLRVVQDFKVKAGKDYKYPSTECGYNEYRKFAE